MPEETFWGPAGVTWEDVITYPNDAATYSPKPREEISGYPSNIWGDGIASPGDAPGDPPEGQEEAFQAEVIADLLNLDLSESRLEFQQSHDSKATASTKIFEGCDSVKRRNVQIRTSSSSSNDDVSEYLPGSERSYRGRSTAEPKPCQDTSVDGRPEHTKAVYAHIQHLRADRWQKWQELCVNPESEEILSELKELGKKIKLYLELVGAESAAIASEKTRLQEYQRCWEAARDLHGVGDNNH